MAQYFLRTAMVAVLILSLGCGGEVDKIVFDALQPEERVKIVATTSAQFGRLALEAPGGREWYVFSFGFHEDTFYVFVESAFPLGIDRVVFDDPWFEEYDHRSFPLAAPVDRPLKLESNLQWKRRSTWPPHGNLWYSTLLGPGVEYDVTLHYAEWAERFSFSVLKNEPLRPAR